MSSAMLKKVDTRTPPCYSPFVRNEGLGFFFFFLPSPPHPTPLLYVYLLLYSLTSINPNSIRKSISTYRNQMATTSTTSVATRGASSSTAPPPPHPPPPPPPANAMAVQVLAQRPILYPLVQREGMAAHPDADPRPVCLVDGPRAYHVSIKVPCRTRSILLLEYMRTPGKVGLHIEGSVDVGEGRVGVPMARRPGMRRLYAMEEFGFTFQFPQRVKRATLIGFNHQQRTMYFLVPKKPPLEPDSDTDDYTVTHFT